MVPYYSITGFYPDEKNDDSLQFEIDIKDAEQKEAFGSDSRSKTIQRNWSRGAGNYGRAAQES